MIFAALASPSWFWQQVMWSLAFVALLSTVVAAICAQGRTRAFALGAAVFGWAMIYFVIASERRYALPPHVLLDWAFTALHGPQPADPEQFYDATDNPFGGPMPLGPVGTPHQGFAPSPSAAQIEYEERQRFFLDTGHAALTLLMTFLGGVIGVMAYVRSRDEERK